MSGRKTYKVNLSDIRNIEQSELENNRLNTLLQGHSSFEKVLESYSDPITIDAGNGKPFGVLDGRHRIYLARQKGYSSISAQVSQNESKVKKVVLALARKEIHAQHNETSDFANGEDKVNIANSMFNQHVIFWITELSVFRESNYNVCKYNMDCKIDSGAKNDLSQLGIGLNGFCN